MSGDLLRYPYEGSRRHVNENVLFNAAEVVESGAVFDRLRLLRRSALMVRSMRLNPELSFQLIGLYWGQTCGFRRIFATALPWIGF